MNKRQALALESICRMDEGQEGRMASDADANGLVPPVQRKATSRNRGCKGEMKRGKENRIGK